MSSPKRAPRDRSPPQPASPPRAGSRSPRSPVRRNDDRRSASPQGREDTAMLEDPSNLGNNLHIGNLSQATTQQDIERRCSQYGKVLNCHLVCVPKTGESRGFSFVTMETSGQADDVIAALHGADFDGKVLSVSKAKRSKPRDPTPGRYLGTDRSQTRRPYYGGRGYDDYDRYRGGYGRRSPDRRYRRSSPSYGRRSSPGYRRGSSPGYNRDTYYRGHSPSRRDSPPRGANYGGGGGGGGGGAAGGGRGGSPGFDSRRGGSPPASYRSRSPAYRRSPQPATYRSRSPGYDGGRYPR